jgi:hypothetical protein
MAGRVVQINGKEYPFNPAQHKRIWNDAQRMAKANNVDPTRHVTMNAYREYVRMGGR